MTICPHCHIKMLSNPLTTGGDWWCPRCGGHQAKFSHNGHSANGHRQHVVNERLEAAVIRKLAAEGLTLSSPWADIEACLSECVSARKCIEAARRMVVPAYQPHPYTVIDIGNAEHYWSLAATSVDPMNIEHFTNRAAFYAERVMTREWDRR